MSRPDFWEDQRAAQRKSQRAMRLRESVGLWQGLRNRARELLELAELAHEDEEADLRSELERELESLAGDVLQQEDLILLGQEYDQNDAIVSIHAGAGGTESQDWAAMLLRMYLRWCQDKGFETTIIDTTEGEEAGVKSVTVEVDGQAAYGYLKAERGVHRLVRISPFDASARRHTSFALVEVMPVLDEDVDIEIDEADLRIDYYRASSAGGQHVNKTSSAVRLVHLASGITVTCQNERSQQQNRATAMRVLKARLVERELERREAEQARLRGEPVSAEWGSQIRSYVLHPYQLVKDHRSGYETSRTQAVLDGELDELILAHLKSRVGRVGAVA
jgi:peptide chain release factor 2